MYVFVMYMYVGLRSRDELLFVILVIELCRIL